MNRTLSPTITVSAAGVTVNAVVESVDGAFDPFAPNGSRSALEQAAHTTAAAASDAMNAVFMSAPSWGDDLPIQEQIPRALPAPSHRVGASLLARHRKRLYVDAHER